MCISPVCVQYVYMYICACTVYLRYMYLYMYMGTCYVMCVYIRGLVCEFWWVARQQTDVTMECQ